MKKVALILLIGSLLSCSSTKTKETTTTESNDTAIVSGVQDGSSYENAIVIKAKDEMTGVAKVYSKLKELYPGYKLVSQGSGSKNGKQYDTMRIITSNGEEKSVYFDISSFYGKF